MNCGVALTEIFPKKLTQRSQRNKDHKEGKRELLLEIKAWISRKDSLFPFPSSL
jgi:hypothetical protein